MPKFLYTILLANLLSAGGTVYVLIKIRPEEVQARPLLLLGLLVFLITGLSLILHKIRSAKKHPLTDPRKTYRESLKVVIPVAIFITGITALKLYRTLTPITGALLAGLILSVVIRSTLNKN
jgi:hypothetical protein